MRAHLVERLERVRELAERRRPRVTAHGRTYLAETEERERNISARIKRFSGFVPKRAEKVDPRDTPMQRLLAELRALVVG